MSVAETFGRICIAADTAFPDALERVRPWLRRLTYPGTVVHRLLQAKTGERFPEDALEFLHLIVNDGSRPFSGLESCLRAIQTSKPGLESDQRFERLWTNLRRQGKNLN